SGSRTGFGALLLGVYDGDDLLYVGRVGTGFNEQLLRTLHKRMKALEVSEPPFVNPPRGAEVRGVHWVQPKLVGEVQFTEWTGDNVLRHPAFLGLREDKDARSVVREKKQHVTAESAESAENNNLKTKKTKTKTAK